MQGTAQDGVIDWVEFDAQDESGEAWRVHVPFMLSSWECLFGRGCPGHFGSGSSTIQTDIGCCTHGAWITSKEDLDHVREMTEKLEPQDWDDERRAYVAKIGDPLIIHKKEDAVLSDEVDEDTGEPVVLVDEEYNIKTRVMEGGCVFANRHNGSVGKTGKTGCAFVHYGMRNGLSHVDTMPQVCWQLPLRVVFDEEHDTNVLIPWDADEWGGEDDDGTHDSWMKWWCIDTPDAYLAHPGKDPVYKTMHAELTKTMGEANYAYLVEVLDERRKQYGWDVNKPAMSTLVQNEGRPLIPLLVGNRKDRRKNPTA